MSTDPAETVAAEHRAMLRELAEIGMQMARILPDKAREQGADGQALSLAYARVSRAIRLTLTLEARSFAEQRDEPADPSYEAPWEADGLSQEQWRAQLHADCNREQSYHLIEKLIENERGERERERLTLGLYERLEDGRDEEAFASEAPVAQVVMAICRDLGIDPDWSDLTDDDWDPISDSVKHQLRLGRYAQTSAHPREGGDPASEPPPPDEAAPEWGLERIACDPFLSPAPAAGTGTPGGDPVPIRTPRAGHSWPG